jgi:NAD(P)-dependent dehydrogenase (short-subunit alcohol dehydrogenase family)
MTRELAGPSSPHRVAVVTGGAKGIGLAISTELAARGYDVAMAGRDLDAITQAQALICAAHPDAQLAGVALDVTHPKSVASAFASVRDQLGPATVLVNNAGIIARDPAESLDDEAWTQVMETDLTGAFRCARAAFTGMRDAGGGAVVNVASIAATVGISGRVAYTASKAGVEGLTRTLALEWARHGIRVNTVSPGWTRTAMVAQGIASGRLDEQRLIARIPQQRLAEPAEIAKVVAFMASPDASYITGQTVIVDGGVTINGDA